MALAYPNAAAVASGNLGFNILQRMLASVGVYEVERFHLPLREGPVQSLPAGARLLRADLVLFSLSYEGDAPSVPALLRAGGLEPLAASRRDPHPLVVGGGALVMINPEPLTAFFDLFLNGEAEAVLFPFLVEWDRLRGDGRERALAEIDERVAGALAPARRQHRLWSTTPAGLEAERLGAVGAPGAPPPEVAADRRVVRAAWSEFAAQPTTVRLAAEAAVGQSYLIEVARGCPRRCRFCAASRIYAPLRECPADLLLARARAEVVPGETVGLLSLSAGDYRGLEDLAAGLEELGVRLSISSLPPGFRRAAAAGRLCASGTRTLTIAPETGSERLRAIVGKPITDDAILETVRMLAGAGVQRLRSYFILGLPFEEEQDVEAIADLCARMRAATGGRAALSVTVNAFVPKPQTPFQWAPMAPLVTLNRRAARLKRMMPRGVALRIKSFREARLQALLSRGDAAWGPRLVRMATEGRKAEQLVRRDDPNVAALLGSVRVGGGLPWGYLLGTEEREALERDWLALQGPARESSD